MRIEGKFVLPLVMCYDISLELVFVKTQCIKSNFDWMHTLTKQINSKTGVVLQTQLLLTQI